MKKTITLSVIALLLRASAMYAQVPNPGFENLNYDGSASNWGNVYLFAIMIDSMGISHEDSIVVDGQFYFATPDAHSGLVAMEMRNAWDFTANEGIAGSVTADTDSVYSSWSSFETVSIQEQPVDFGFYYEYFPVGDDSAIATLQVFDEFSNMIGEARIILSGTTNVYTYATTPVLYTLPGTVVYYYMNFSTAVYGSVANLGTRFLVDDVEMNTTTGINLLNANNEFEMYPNPSGNQIRINVLKNEPFEIEMVNALGTSVLKRQNENRLDISGLAAGVYFVNIRQGNSNLTKKLLKQ